MHPHNQAPELKDYNLYTSDPALRRAVQHHGAQWRDAELLRQGAAYGAEATLRAAEDANQFEPVLHTHSRGGDRIDEVRFHPAWHQMMTMARASGIANLPFADARASVWPAYGASLYMHSQIESGSTCPTTMTKASIPVLQLNTALYAALQPKLLSTAYDARDIPLAEKQSITIGMGMTERQGGSDLRTNTTRAQPTGVSGDWGEEYLITGQKWFFSAPMCDGHLVLAQTGEGRATCFFVPRWRPDGSKNAVFIQRLKDKVGNRSNSSSEVEFHEAWGVRVGDEGRGIPTIIEMATYTRLDCALSSAGFMRQGFAQALFYTRNRHAFGKALAEQPAMTTLLADMALESEAATLLAMDLAARFGSDEPLDQAWRRIVTPVAKFWNCKRAVGFAGEAMETFGGNGYVETGPMGRLFREAPVNSIWEGSGNVMCLDVLRALARRQDDMHLLLDHLRDTATQEPRLLAQVEQLRASSSQPPQALEREARRFTQRLALLVQSCLMLGQASSEMASAFIVSRWDPDWGPVLGAACGTDRPEALLRAAWVD
ncbi:acyl-CoA dehydrogenase family protein [Comamonas sp. GB3 AK4-5]|uniref:acyl-CoA dehydrogenase family protein n=1 Tax=Comamonas sp. GB3 AK4-5 TaxID=3231487 RepID=UPI00351EF6B2